MEQKPHQPDAFCQLVTAYEKDLLRICFVYLRDTGMAEDAVQDTFVKAYQGYSSFEGRSSEKTWLMKIAMNTCRDMRRKAWFRYIDRRIDIERLNLTAQAPDAEQIALTTAIMQLPPKDLEIILLRYYEEMPVKDIAQLLGVTSSAVSQRLEKARNKLKTHLEGEKAYDAR